jgi:putative transposase
MSTYTQIIYHIVFSTKNRICCLSEDKRPELFRYISGIIKHKDCHLYQINGFEDHLHILTDIKPTLNLADLVKDIKVASSLWIKQEKLFPRFSGWQDGYSAFTYSNKDKENIVAYIKKQSEHHRQKSFIAELKELLVESDIPFDEKYII